MAKVTFIEVEPSAILDDVINRYQQLSGSNISEGQPEYAICSSIAYALTLVYNQVNNVGNNLLLTNASSTVLDYIARLVGIERLSASYAACSIKFSLDPNHLRLTIPQGTRISTSDGLAIFDTIDDIPVEAGVTEVTVTAKCEVGGESYNGYAIGALNTMIDPLAYVTSVSNIDITSGGADEESDDELKSRVQLAPSSYSCAGPKNAYILYAKKASSKISDVKVMSYEDDNQIPVGEIDVYSLLAGGVIPSVAICDLIAAELNDEKVRPLTDAVKVKIPAQIPYSITADIVKTPDGGDSITHDIYAVLRTYTDACAQELGIDVVMSKIIQLCMSIDGVYSATATIKSDGIAEKDQLTIFSNPTSEGSIQIILNGTKYSIPVYKGSIEKETLTITSPPEKSGKVTLALDGVNYLLPVNSGTQEIDTMQVMTQPSKTGNVNVTIGAVTKSVPVTIGVSEVDKLVLTCDSFETTTDIEITLNDVSYVIPVSIATSAINVMNTILGTTFNGWTVTAKDTSGTKSQCTITFTNNSVGACTAPAISDIGNATATFTRETIGENKDTRTSIAARIAALTFDGWTMKASGTTITMTKGTIGTATLPSFDDVDATGVTATIVRTQEGTLPETAADVAVNVTKLPLTGWNATSNSNIVTLTRISEGECKVPTFTDTDATLAAGVFVIVNAGSKNDDKITVANRIAGMSYIGWTVEAKDNVIEFTMNDISKCVRPEYIDAGNTGVNAVFNRIQQGFTSLSDGNLVLDNSQVSKLEGITININETHEL